jgi:hypothetical protein
MRVRRSLPDDAMVWANFTCSPERLPSGLSLSSLERISSELSGVRSSWDMLARKSDLYWLACSSSRAFSETAAPVRSSSSRWVSSVWACSSNWLLVCSSSTCCCSKSGLGFLQRATLFFQLLVGDPQLLALNLQFFGLSLGFLQHVLQFGTIARGPQGDADGARGLLQKLDNPIVDGMQEAQFDDGVDPVVGMGRHENQMPGLVAPQRRADGQVAVGNVANDHRLSVGGDLAQEPFLDVEADRHVGVGRNPQGRGAIELAAFALEQRARLGAEILRQEAQDAVAELLDRLVAHHRVRKADLAGLQPFLPRASARAATDQDEHAMVSAAPRRPVSTPLARAVL